MAGTIVYSRAQLIALCRPKLPPGERPVIPLELRRRARGCRSGVKRRAKTRRYKPSVPSIITGNVRSLANKTDELGALVMSERIFRESSLLCFTETWLHADYPDHSASLPGFRTVRADRDATQSGKKRGGGIAVYVNERWCHPDHVCVKERFCSPNIELLAVGMRPYYLPREFTSAIVVVVYVPPSADAEEAVDTIHSTVSALLNHQPGAFMAITGDFNHTTLDKALPTFHQYIDCPTRNNKTLDLLYANTKDAYSATALPPLGRSDHDLVRLTPRYVPLVKRLPVTTRTVRRWSLEANDALQDCFESTDWDVLCGPHGEDINSMTDCITEYIKFCEHTTIPSRTVRCFPNNKPWITRDLKALLNMKKAAFRSGDRDELRRAQRNLKVKLREGKDSYRRKLEAKLQLNNTREVWSGMKQITGFKVGGRQPGGSLERANELNCFFNRFSSQPSPVSSTHHTSQTPPPPLSPLLSCTSTEPSITMGSSTLPPLSVTTDQVRRQLEKLHQRRAEGPDGISPRVLKTCATQLSGVLQRLFNLSLRLGEVPVLWKTSCLVPVPKKSTPSGLNDYRPVALTSHVMKVLERLVLAHLRPQVKSSLDPLQFAYQPHVGVDDAIIYLLQRAQSHLDGTGVSVRVTFFDFSSAFNTIQPLLLSEKLRVAGVDASTISWITDYLTGRPQFVRMGRVLSGTVVSDVGAPQGTVLSPFLFTLYTSDFQYNTESCHLQKYSDDSAVVGCIRDGREEEYRAVVSDFVKWADENHLRLNVAKTREMVVDFRRKATAPTPLSVLGVDVDMVEEYKYLGVSIDSRLNWKANINAVYKKGMSRLFFLRKLRSFNVCSKMLELFYQSVVASVLHFAIVCWGSSIGAGDTSRLNKLVRKAGSIIGCQLEHLEQVVERRTLKKLVSILDNPDHPLHHLLQGQRSTFSRRLLTLRCHKERYRRTFLPTAMRLYNSSPLARSP